MPHGKGNASMARVILLLGCLACLLLAPAAGAAGTPAGGCTFRLGFAALDALLPQQIGACLQDEQHNADNGDALQRTSGGLLVWRKADNFTAFTDGSRTWVNGPAGLALRLDGQRFAFEANPQGLPIVDQPSVAVAAISPSVLQAGTRSVVVLTLADAVPAGAVVAEAGTPAVRWSRFLGPRLLAVELDVPADAMGSFALRADVAGIALSAELRAGAALPLGTGFGSPDDAAVAADGTVYFSDFGNAGVNSIAPDGSRGTLAHGIAEPEGIAVEGDGNLIVGDQRRNAVLRLERASGRLSTIAAIPNSSGADGVDGLALDPGSGDILFPDSPNGRLLRISADGSRITVLLGRFVRPTGMALAGAGNIVVADEYGGRVYRIAATGAVAAIGGAFLTPDDVVLDRGGDVLVNSLGDGTVKLIPADGSPTRTLVAGLRNPHGLALDPADNAVIVDSDRNRLLRLVRTFAVTAAPSGAAFPRDVPLALVRAAGFSDAVTWHVVGAPAGVDASLAVDPAMPELALLHLAGTPPAAGGTVVIRAASGALHADAWVPLP